VEHGRELRIGSVALQVVHVPGHTPDSIALLVTDLDRGTEPWFVLTGDTLFVGDVGRPDFGGEQAAASLYASLTERLLRLPDSVEVYPAHGAGSSCGRAMSSKTATTIGFERRFNAALQVPDAEEFVRRLMTGLPPKPEEFGEAHIPGALNVWIESPQFANRVGLFAPAEAPVVLVVASPTDLGRAVQGLGRVGLDAIAGHLQWGMTEWKGQGLPLGRVPQISVHDLATMKDERPDLVVVDVRELVEWDEGHIDGALHLPMGEALARKDLIPAGRPKAVLCAGGLRSSTVISALSRAGFTDFYNVIGGMTAWQKGGYSTVKR